DFNWALREAAPKVPWETRFKELVRYKAKHGDCNVPHKQGKLGTWVHTQRRNYTTDSLEQDRIDRLSSIGFKWTLAGPPVPWETRFDELVQYKAKHGDCNVPRKRGCNVPLSQSQEKLGNWVIVQRRFYRKGKLAQDRIDRLNGIGFAWTLTRGLSRKRNDLPRTQNKSSSMKERASLLSTTVESLSIGAEARGDETIQTMREERESDDEVEEIGALIYDQVMQRRKVIRTKEKMESISLSSNLPERHGGKSKDDKP
ncbi:hypothetical protein THAOC_32616, partial [Thalassiosira oceanica]